MCDHELMSHVDEVLLRLLQLSDALVLQGGLVHLHQDGLEDSGHGASAVEDVVGDECSLAVGDAIKAPGQDVLRDVPARLQGDRGFLLLAALDKILAHDHVIVRKLFAILVGPRPLSLLRVPAVPVGRLVVQLAQEVPHGLLELDVRSAHFCAAKEPAGHRPLDLHLLVGIVVCHHRHPWILLLWASNVVLVELDAVQVDAQLAASGVVLRVGHPLDRDSELADGGASVGILSGVSIGKAQAHQPFVGGAVDVELVRPRNRHGATDERHEGSDVDLPEQVMVTRRGAVLPDAEVQRRLTTHVSVGLRRPLHLLDHALAVARDPLHHRSRGSCDRLDVVFRACAGEVIGIPVE
mmetsp:Transcript_20470/g.52188  ORF Transcript_20470/g.52188 Transcript_20470/m.52188 type:complete len:352 (-) Transcript_20470:632-1687(-)